MHKQTRHTDYNELPLIDLNAPKTLSSRNRAGTVASNDSIMHDLEDAKRILELAGLCINLSSEHVIDATEKCMIEVQPSHNNIPTLSSSDRGTKQKSIRKPHYSHLLLYNNIPVFQVACCLPLKVLAASLDGNPVFGRVLFSSHSEENGGKLVYEFQNKGTEIIIDLQRGESQRVQRYLFRMV